MPAAPSYRRAVRPLYPPFPDGVCDCELLPFEYPTILEELVHTRLVDAQPLELSLDAGHSRAQYTIEVRQCPDCGQWWWAERSSRVDITYARDSDNTVPVGSVHVELSSAVRCADHDEAHALTSWWAEYQEALAVRDRYARKDDGRGVARCIELGARSAATQMLSESTARSVKLARNTRAALDREMQACIEILNRKPDDEAAWTELQRLQRRCALARGWDAAAEPQDWTIEEWWTPALAGVSRLEFELHAVRHAARGKALGSPEHLELRRCEDELATRWEAHCARVEWPSLAVGFHALLEHAKLLQPLVVAGDMASWRHPDRIGRILREWFKDGVVTPTRHLAVAPWLAARTGLPDSHIRHEERNRANYWLPIRRAMRAEAQRS